MDSDRLNDFDALNDIRDSVFLLSLGRAYLCERPFMKKIGLTIDSRLEKLQEDILSLKKRFPGKFVREVETDEIVEKLHQAALRLQDPDEETHESCTVGLLGGELEETMRNLTEAIRTIRVQVEGVAPPYTKTDSFLGLLGRLSPLGRGGSLPAKWLGVFLAVVFLAFMFLYFTMQTEATLLKEIAESEAHIRSQKGIVSELVYQKEEISRKISAMMKDDLSRQAKITIMDLNIKVHEVDEKISALEADITLNEKRLENNRKMIEELEKKSFIRRLLRQ